MLHYFVILRQHKFIGFVITLICISTFISTLLGGLFALKLTDKLYLVLGFSAGAVIGVAFFDLMPTALLLASKTYSSTAITSLTAVGFIIYLTVDRFVVLLSRFQASLPRG